MTQQGEDAATGFPSCVQVTREHLERVRSSKFHAVNSLISDAALRQAARVDRARAAGAPLPLDGMSVLVKDTISVLGCRHECGSALFAGRRARVNARAVTNLLASGAVVLGTTQSSELMYGMTAHPSYPPSLNPWDVTVTPGWSSGGSASALAEGLAEGALGTDTGGSVRVPAALCGVTGLRPTPGVISTTGVAPLASSFDTVGPMARSAADVRALFQAASRTRAEDFGSSPIRRRVMIANGFFSGSHGAAAVDSTAAALEQLGYSIDSIDLPMAEDAYQAFVLIVRHEAFRLHHALIQEPEERLSRSVRDRLVAGAEISDLQLLDARRVQQRWNEEVATVFAARTDFILTPASPSSAPTMAEAMRGEGVDATRFAYPWSLARVPTVSMPAGATAAGMPVGVQITAATGSDESALELASHFQSVTDWHLRRPI